MTLAKSPFEAPSAISDRTSKSIETLGSPASIFATRDWLDLTTLANSPWVRRRCTRWIFSPFARRRRRSTNARCSADKPRKSPASPTAHPRSRSLRRLATCIIVLPQPSATGFDDLPRRTACLLGKDISYDDRIGVDSIDDSPGLSRVINPQFVASRTDGRHRPTHRQTDDVTRLQTPEQIARLNPCRLTEWRTLDLAPQPRQGSVLARHSHSMSILTYRSS
jgi:hypothetical protein